MSNRRAIIDGPGQFELQIRGLDQRRGSDRSLRFVFADHDIYCPADMFVLNSLGIPDRKKVVTTDCETWTIEMTSRTDGTRWRGIYSSRDRTGWAEPVKEV